MSSLRPRVAVGLRLKTLFDDIIYSQFLSNLRAEKNVGSSLFFLLFFHNFWDHYYLSHSLSSSEMYAFPNYIDSLLGNFSICGPATLHLFPDEDPLNTTITAYTKYLGVIDITKENADNLTQVT